MANRIFTDNEELEIAKIYKAGCSARAIGRAYGLSTKTAIISALRRTKTQQRSPAERNRKYYANQYAFDNIDNEQVAYWWGFLYADGSIYKRSLAVTLKRSDEHHLYSLKLFLKSEHPINRYKNNCSNGKTYPSSLFYITYDHLAKRLKDLGIVVGRTRFNTVPSNLPLRLENHWIRGLFDGDGSVSSKKRTRQIVSFCGKPEKLRWIRERLHISLELRNNQTIRKHRTANLFYLDYSGRLQGKKIGEYLYNNATIYLERKKVRFDLLSIAPPKLKKDAKGRFLPRTSFDSEEDSSKTYAHTA